MKKHLSQYTAFALVLVLLISLVPQAFAAQTTSSVMLFDQASPNYTITLNSQVSIKYKPNGTGSSTTAYLKNIGWHYARYGGVAYPDKPIYCIEPAKNFNSSSSGNFMDTGVTVSGSGYTQGQSTWYAMPESYRRAITLVLLYSDQMWDDSYSVTSTYRDNNPNTPLRLATQFIIYEVVTGIRDAESFIADGNGYEDGDILYNAGLQVSDFATNYHALVSNVQSAMALPSFVGATSSSAPTIDLDEDSVLTWMHDDNGVMSNFTFTGDDNVNFNPYGDDLCIERLGDISSSKVYSCYRDIPSPDSSSVAIYYGNTSYQACVGLHTPSTGRLYGYFKLNAPISTGNFNVIKQTSDGQNLSGWKFSIYYDANCTSLMAGPYTTSSAGRISFSGATPGTYYVREEGHSNATVAAKYSCTSSNPQRIVVTAGQTSSVTFVNTLKPGTVNIKKTTSDGKNLQGWQFSLYNNAACTTLISGPHTTNASGTISVSNLTAGTVYIKEIGHQDSEINALYTCASTNPQAVTVTAGGTATVSFTNTLISGDIGIIKETSTGENRNGWRIGIFTDAACTKPITGSPFVTGVDGTIVASVTPGTYYAKEEPRNDPYWQCDTSVKTILATAGKTTSVTFRNTHLGRIEFQKTTSTGEHLSGWTFRVIDADGNTVGDFTTDSSGKAQTGLLAPGKYKVQELVTGDYYWQMELGLHDVTVKAGETSIDKWHNVEQGLVWFHKETSTGENTSGWEITIYSDEACTTPVQTVTTLEEGKIGVYLSPGVYWAKETGDTKDRFDDPYWQIDASIQEFEIKPHKDTAITFRNFNGGNIRIIKTMEPEGPLDGWVFKVTDSTGKEIEGSPFTTTETGVLECGLIQPGTYTVEERIPEDSLYQCASTNPQTVTVKAGETTKVSFVNSVRSGKITIYKVDTNGQPLADAKFKLEWSKDGEGWQQIQYSDTPYPVMGACGNETVVNGCLISGEDGIVEWTNLYPGILYRVMEQEAPSGYILLTEAAFQGELPENDLTVTLRVVNGEGFVMPDTGSSESFILALLLILYASASAYSSVMIYRKRW